MTVAIAGLAVAGLVTTTLPASASAPIRVSGSSWLGGSGVNVCAPSTDAYCGTELRVGGVSSNWWQCVELAQRLYKARGWHSGIFAGVGGASDIYDVASNLGMSRQANGAISSLVPGDMIIHGTDTGGGYGHVSIVNSVSGGTVTAVEQNASTTGWATYSFNGSTLSRPGTGTIRGVVHDPDNTGSPSTPAPVSDSDGDGVADSSDQCVYIPGLTHQQGCRQPMATYQGDYNGDGKKDTAAFYAYPERGNAVGLFVWDGNGDGTFALPRQPWYTPSGWEWRRVIPAGAGDYNGDGRTDLSIFYRYDGGVVRVITLYANADGTFALGFSPEETGMEGFNLIPAGVGDYNGDGMQDIASFYRYPERGNALGLLVWSGNGDGTFTYAQTKWYTASGWEGHRVIFAGVGTFDADNRTDVSAFYRYDGNVVRMFVWHANADGTFAEPTVAFYASSGWDGSHLLPMGVGDYNGDGMQDIASFYSYPERGNALGMFVWYGNGDGTFGSPSLVWYTPSGWEWLRVIPVSVGDFNTDGRSDISVFYRYDGNVVRMWTWFPSATTFPEPGITFYASSGWDGNHLLT